MCIYVINPQALTEFSHTGGGKLGALLLIMYVTYKNTAFGVVLTGGYLLLLMCAGQYEGFGLAVPSVKAAMPSVGGAAMPSVGGAAMPSGAAMPAVGGAAMPSIGGAAVGGAAGGAAGGDLKKMLFDNYCLKNKLRPGKTFPTDIKYTNCTDPCDPACSFTGPEQLAVSEGPLKSVNSNSLPTLRM